MRKRRPNQRGAKRAGREGGFALLAAVFVLVVLAALGSFTLRLSSLQQSGFGLALMEKRSYFAARSGLEWAIHQVANTSACPAASFGLSEGAADGFSVTVGCETSSHVGGTTSTELIRLTASASYGTFGDRDFVSRSMEAVVTR